MAGYIRTADAAYLKVGMKNLRNQGVHNGDFINGILGKVQKSEMSGEMYKHLEERKESFDKTFEILVIDDQTNFDAEDVRTDQEILKHFIFFHTINTLKYVRPTTHPSPRTTYETVFTM